MTSRRGEESRPEGTSGAGEETRRGSVLLRISWPMILALAVLARLASILIFNRMGSPDSGSEPWQIATNLYRGRGYAFDWYFLYKQPVVGSFLPPLYPGILALALALAGGVAHRAMILAQALNVVLGTITVYLAGLLAAMVARARGGSGGGVADRAGGANAGRAAMGAERLAGLAWALYPPALGHAAQPQTQVLETFLLVLLLFLVARGAPLGWSASGAPAPERGPSWKSAIAPGVCLGLLLLTRPTAGLIWVFWAIYLWRASARAGRARDGIRFVLVSSFAALLVLTPWTVRNARVHHRLVPVATNGGFNFYLGNNPETRGGIPPLHLFFTRMPEAEQEGWRSLTETERDQRFYTLGLRYWREHPGPALAAAGRRFVDFAFFRPYLFLAYPGWLAALFVASYLVILVPFVAALPRCRGPACRLGVIAIAATALAGCAYVVSMRFRATVEPLMVALAAGTHAERLGPRTELIEDESPSE